MSIPFVCNSLLKYLLRPLSVPPYHAHGVTDISEWRQNGLFCSPECLDLHNLLVKISGFPVGIDFVCLGD